MRQTKYAMAFAIAISTLLFSGAARAEWPERPITLVAPYPPGGNADVMARLVGQSLGKRLGQTVVVENRPGAGGMVGSHYVVNAKPDGYTFLLGSIANSLYPFFIKSVPYDVKTDLVPVSHIVNVPNFFAVSPKSKFQSVPALIEEAKKNPNADSCGTTGVGTSTYLSCELFKSKLGLKITNVPYKGGVPAMTDVIGGQTTFVIANEVLPYAKDGRLNAIGVTSKEASPLAPQIKPISQIIKDFDVVSWYGVFAPAKTDPAIVEKISSEIQKVVQEDDVKKKMATIGATPVGSTPAEFKTYFDSEVDKWARETKAMNIRPN